MLKVVIFVIVFVGVCSGSKPNAPTIPAIDDPLYIEDFELDIGSLNITEGIASGIISLSNGAVTGLSGLVDKITITSAPGIGQPLRHRLTVNISLPEAEIRGSYTADVKLHLSLIPPLGNISLTGAGSLSGSLKNLHVSVEAFVIPLGKSSDINAAIRDMQINIVFDEAVVNIENLALNEIPIDWDAPNANIKGIFDGVWEEIKEPVSTVIGSLVNQIIEDCSIFDFIGIIGGGSTDCLKAPTAPPPTPTTESNTNTPTESNTNTPTESNTNTPTESNTNTPTESNTNTPTESNTNTPTENNTPTSTENNTPASTENNTPTTTENNTPTSTENNTPTTTENFSPGTKINTFIVFMGILLNICFIN